MDPDSRIERRQSNFDTLKGEYLNLHRQHNELKDEYTDLSRNYVKIAEKSEEVIKKLQEERDLKIVECEELKAEMLTPSQMIDLKESMKLETDEMYRKQLESLEVELEVLKSEHRKLLKNYDYLQSEHELLQVSCNDKLTQLKLRYQNEISEYKQNCKELANRLERDIPNEVLRVRQLQRENAEFVEQNHALLTENEDLRTQINHKDTVKDQHTFTLNQQISELQTELDHVSNDKIGLKNQKDHLQHEIDSQMQLNQSLTKQLLECQKERNILKRKLDDCIHEQAKQTDTLKRKHIQELNLFQEEKRKYCEELEQCQLHIETQEITIQQLEGVVSEKSKEQTVAIEKAVEVEWQKRVEVEKEKMALEKKLSELQRENLSHSEAYGRTTAELRDQLASLQNEKSLLTAELQSVKQDLHHKELTCSQISKEQFELKELKNKVSSYIQNINSLEESKRGLEEENEGLQMKNQLLCQQLQSVQSEMSQLNEVHFRDTEKIRYELGEERSSLRNRLDELSSQKKSLQEKLSSVKKKKAKLQKEHQRSIHEVERLLELAHENEKQAMLEKNNMRKSADEEIKSLKCQLKAVKKQHQQFISVMSNSPEVYKFSAQIPPSS